MGGGSAKKQSQSGRGSLKDKALSKKEAVTGQARGDRKATFIGLGVAAVIIAVVGFVLFGGGGSGSFAVVKAQAGEVRIPLPEVSDGHAHYYTFKGTGGGKDINFFVLKSSDGIVRAAFDACDVCYRERKGYRQEGDLMVCNNCGQQFPSVKINEIRGGCNPAPLERSVEGGELVMKVSDIETGGFYF